MVVTLLPNFYLCTAGPTTGMLASPTSATLHEVGL